MSESRSLSVISRVWLPGTMQTTWLLIEKTQIENERKNIRLINDHQKRGTEELNGCSGGLLYLYLRDV